MASSDQGLAWSCSDLGCLRQPSLESAACARSITIASLPGAAQWAVGGQDRHRWEWFGGTAILVLALARLRRAARQQQPRRRPLRRAPLVTASILVGLHSRRQCQQGSFAGLKRSVAVGRAAVEGPSSAHPGVELEEASNSAPQEPAPKPKVLFVLGGPGAGKGTQCERIISTFDHWGHISAGDCLREERSNPRSKDGELIDRMIEQGKLVPSDLTVRLLEKALFAQHAAGKTHILVDGFPRNLENVDCWREIIGDKVDESGILFLEASETELERRLLERGKTSGRADDNPESIKQRFKTFQNETLPVVTSGRFHVHKIDGMQPVEEVWKSTQAIIQVLFSWSWFSEA